ncbi:hypothetical protein ACFX2I_043833 [Malus domestica]
MQQILCCIFCRILLFGSIYAILVFGIKLELWVKKGLAQKKVQKEEKSKAQPKPRRKNEPFSRHLLTYLEVKWCRPAS